MRAAGLNPTDVRVPGGALDGVLPHAFPVVLGWDAAGVVDAVGVDAPFLPGDAVIAFTRSVPLSAGALAEYVVVDGGAVARKPTTTGFTAAAVLPLAGLMAHQLVEALAPQPGARVLVLGAGGGVGTYLLQLLTHRAVQVAGTDSSDKASFLHQYGADGALDYEQPLAEQLATAGHPCGFDAIIDLAGGAALAAAAPLLTDQGQILSTMQPPQAVLGDKARGTFLVVQPDGAALQALADLVDDNKLRLPPVKVSPFNQATAQIAAMHHHHGGGGKIAVSLESVS